jgi:hypothetical protein
MRRTGREAKRRLTVPLEVYEFGAVGGNQPAVVAGVQLPVIFLTDYN